MRRWLAILIVSIAALLAAPGASAQPAETRIALIIANESHVSPALGRLPGTQRDAAAMRDGTVGIAATLQAMLALLLLIGSLSSIAVAGLAVFDQTTLRDQVRLRLSAMPVGQKPQLPATLFVGDLEKTLRNADRDILKALRKATIYQDRRLRLFLSLVQKLNHLNPTTGAPLVFLVDGWAEFGPAQEIVTASLLLHVGRSGNNEYYAARFIDRQLFT